MEVFLPERLDCGPVREVVLAALFLALELHLEFTRREFSESCLEALEKNLIPVTLESIHQLFCIRQFVAGSTTDFRGTKLHLVLHFGHFIRQFGSPLNWDTSSFESAHKVFVKACYRRGSKRLTGLTLETLHAVR